MPKLSFVDSLLRRGKHSIPSDVLKADPVLNIREGEAIVLTYTSAADKMKVFSAFIREGLENGDQIVYTCPDEDIETVRTKLKEHRINVEKYERNGALILASLTKYYMANGKLDYDKTISECLNLWAEAKRKGYKHIRELEDVGDFSFVNGQWQKWITECWLDPRWDDPNVSEWVESKGTGRGTYDPFIMEITAINVEHMKETEIAKLLKAFGEGNFVLARCIDLIEEVNSFSRSIGLDHERLVGRRILLEFDPISDYEKVVDSLSKEAMANVEPIYVFTSSASPIHTYLAKQPTINFFLTSLSTSTPKSTSENKVLLPAKNAPLILDAIDKVLENHAGANVCFVFDILSELLSTVGRERTFTFLRQALDLLSSKKVTSLFLLNSNAHEPKMVSQLSNLFSNQLTYDKKGLEVVKTS